MPRAAACPEPGVLHQFLLGDLPDADAERLEAHLKGCPACLAALGADRGSDQLVAAVRAEALSPAGPDSEVLQGLMHRLSEAVQSVMQRLQEDRPREARSTASGGLPSDPGSGVGTAGAVDFLRPAGSPGEMGRLGPYHVRRLLGEGGMGLVFHADDPQLERAVALKVLRPALAASPAAHQRFLREARAAAAMEHDHVVPIYQVGEDQGVPFLAMQLLKGETLEDRLRREGKLPVAEVLRIGREIADGLAAAHARGLVHRDVKPANVWLEEGGRVKILDFGLVRYTQDEVGPGRPPGPPSAADNPGLTQEGIIVGTPAFMSPEQAEGRPATEHSDLFSLGCVLYRLATGALPFDGRNSAAILRAVVSSTPRRPRALNPRLPAGLDRLIGRLLAKVPSGRPASAREVIAALGALQARHAPAARPRLLTAAAFALGVAVALAAAVVLYARTDKGEVVIESDDPDVQVVAEQHGRLVKILDPNDRQSLVLDAGSYNLRLCGRPDGLRIDLPDGPFKIGRGETRTIVVRRVAYSRPPTPEELARRPSPLDARKREDIPAVARTLAGQGDPARAPAELVGVLGEPGFRLLLGLASWPAYSGDGKLLAVPKDKIVRLFDADTGRLRQTLAGHGNRVVRVAFTPDGKALASASEDGTVKVWEAATGRELRTLRGAAGALNSLAVSPDGKTVVAGGVDKEVHPWDLATGEARPAWPGHAAQVCALAFSPDGRLLASADVDGAVRLWEAATGRLQDTLHDDALRPASGLAFSPDGQLLAAGSDRVLKLWDVVTRKVVRSAETPAVFVAFSPDGRTLLTAALAYLPGIPHKVRRWETAGGKELEGLKLRGEGEWLFACLSPDGRTIAGLGVHDTVVRLYDAASGRPRFPAAGHTRMALAVAFSPDGKRLASAGDDRVVRVWDLAAGKEVLSLEGHVDSVRGVAFSPDGKLLATAGWDKTVRLWDVDGPSAGPPRTLSGHTDKVEAVAFSPDGKRLASAGWDHAVRLWDVRTGEALQTLAGHGEAVVAVAFSPDGQTLASAGPEGKVLLWDAAAGVPRRELPRTAPVQGLAFLPDGETLAAACSDGSVPLWNWASGELKQTLSLPGAAHAVAPHPAGLSLAVSGGEGTVGLWDLRSDPPRRQTIRLMPWRHWVVGAAFSPEGRHLATANEDGTLSLLRVPHPLPAEEPEGEVRQFRADDFVWAAAFAPDGTRVLAGGRGPALQLWDAATGKEVRRFEHGTEVEAVAFTADGRRVLAGGSDGLLRLWDVETGQQVGAFEKAPTQLTGVALSRDGRLALSAGFDGVVRVWDVETGKPLRQLKGHAKVVIRVAFSPDGGRALSSSDDGTVRLWDVKTGEELRRWDGEGPVRDVAFAPDGRRALAGGAKAALALWDLDTGKEVRRYPGHGDWVHGVALSPDGRRALSGSKDRTVRLWDVETGQELALFEGHGGRVQGVAFSPDGRFAVSAGGDDRTVRTWRLPDLPK
jgi:WD40 repeat protein